MRYGFVEANSKRRTVKELCRVLDVSESGYYRYLKNKGKPEKDVLLSDEMKKILEEHPCNDNYGAPRMKQALEQRGFEAGLRRITRIMRQHGWLHTPRRRPKGLTMADPEAMAAENLIKQDFSAEEPYRKLLTDITQIQCADGKLYISPILDCFNGEVLSLCMRDNMKKELCIDTVQALQRYPVKDAILHSDRGSQYTSAAFREVLETLHIRQSLSGVDHCYDNARMESFFATLKKELLYRLPTYRMPMEEVKTKVFRYVFIYYNQLRVYTRNQGGWPPSVFRRMQLKLAA
ncbi:MAG: IS3 family transposase [Oscillospiraceae bacterium]|nr:IS3 family transposase [Oscillospiraceae bacterium]